MGGVCSCSILQQMGLTKGKKEVRGMVIGDNAVGKTTLLYNMKLGRIVNCVPTVGFNVESFELDKFRLNLWDLGGGCRVKELWPIYCQGNELLLFVVHGAYSGAN